MRKGFAIWLCGLTLAFGCAGSETEPPLVPLDKVEATKLSGEPLEYLPFHYRTTDASVADAAQILSDQEAWLSISSLSGGHSTFPTEGYHWYALKLSNEDARSLGVSLMVESEWWVDYKAWSVADDRVDLLEHLQNGLPSLGGGPLPRLIAVDRLGLVQIVAESISRRPQIPAHGREVVDDLGREARPVARVVRHETQPVPKSSEHTRVA